MKKTKQRSSIAPNRPPVQNRTIPGRTAGNGRLAQIQQQADQSPATERLDAVQRRANGVLQPEVDTSRSPSVGRGDPDYKYPLPETDGVPTWAAESYGNAAYGTDGKLKNDPADGVPEWASEEYKKVGKTGTVDTSSGPRLPAYGPNEKPGWQKNDPTGVPKWANREFTRKERTGVPDWARKEYQKDAPKTLIASVADGKIGSIYFPGGRIRTTHGRGPVKSAHGDTLQYNIDRDKAEAEFARKHKRLYRNLLREGKRQAEQDSTITEEMIEHAASKAYFKAEARYIAKKLNVPNPSKMPAFVRLVTRGRKLPSWAGDAIKSPDDAPDFDTDTNRKMLEVFRRINGKVEGWHPSRGAAKKWKTNKQVISVLHAAIKHIKNVEGVDARNIAFYHFIYHRIPSFAAQIRKPDEI